MSNKETIVALKSDEQASLSPGAYEVLTGAVERADPGPLSSLRMKLRTAVAGFQWLQGMAPGEYARMAELLEAPEWMQAAEEANALRTSLAHWKVFAEHAEGERSSLSADAARLDRFEDWLADRAGPLLHIDDVRSALDVDGGPQSAVAAAYGGLVQTAQG
jgi:hypothetical protein